MAEMSYIKYISFVLIAAAGAVVCVLPLPYAHNKLIAVYILSEIPFYYSLPFSVRLIE